MCQGCQYPGSSAACVCVSCGEACESGAGSQAAPEGARAGGAAECCSSGGQPRPPGPPSLPCSNSSPPFCTLSTLCRRCEAQLLLLALVAAVVYGQLMAQALDDLPWALRQSQYNLMTIQAAYQPETVLQYSHVPLQHCVLPQQSAA